MKSKILWGKLFSAIVAILLVAVIATPVLASPATATRTPPTSVAAGAEFGVTVTPSGCGAFGQVVETLPDGFTYLSCTPSYIVVAEVGNTVKFTFLSSESLTYRVKAPSVATPTIYTFHGIVKDEDKNEYPIEDNQITVTSPPPVGGGGGWALPTPPPGTTDVSDIVGSDGAFTERTTAQSEDGNCVFDIDEGTEGLTEDGEPLDEITLIEMEDPPSPPEDSNVIGLTYDFGPDGATFDPPAKLSFKYDEALIPKDVAEKNLTAAMWDGTKWVKLTCVVDTVNNIITAEIAHFTPFTILAYTSPAAFVASDLSVTPAAADIGETVTISVLVTNTGDLTGSYEVVLKIDNEVVAAKEVAVAGGRSEQVSFNITKDTAGSYAVSIDGLSGTFVVRAPAAFVASDLSITPGEVDIGESVAIGVVITNSGDLTGSYEVVLKIDNEVVAAKEVAVAGGRSEQVSFNITKDTAGSYAVSIDGLSGSFMVREPINWPVISGVIAGVIVVGLLIFFLIRRRAY